MSAYTQDGDLDVLPRDFDLLQKRKLAFKVDITDYNLSKNKHVYGISHICQEADVIEELELKAPTIEVLSYYCPYFVLYICTLIC